MGTMLLAQVQSVQCDKASLDYEPCDGDLSQVP